MIEGPSSSDDTPPAAAEARAAEILDGRYRMVPDVVMRDVEGGLLLVNLATGGTWKLNRTGAAVCRELERGAMGREVLRALDGRFSVPGDVLARDVVVLCESLLSAGLIARL